MARQIGSVCKLCRHCSVKLMLKGSRCLTPKCAMERQKKGAVRRRRRVSDRGLQLIEKQKVRWTYGLMERQFRGMFEDATKQKGMTGENLLVLLERRCDNVVFRLGFADSRAQARQLVEHGLIMINGHRASIPSRLIKEGDTISWTPSGAKTEYYKQVLQGIESKALVNWLSLDRQNLVGRAISLPTINEIGAEFNSMAIVEYYSR